MDTRIKKFLNRRSRSSVSFSGLEHQGIPEQFSPGPGRPSIFPYRSRAHSTSDAQKALGNHAMYVQSFSYDSVPAGKAPIMGKVPQKGNGPIKLQASRRLSSGELMVTTQDPRRTLQDIREGDYIVGRKERPMSRDHGTAKAATTNSRILSHHQDSPATFAPPNSQTWPGTPRPESQSVLPTFQLKNAEVASANMGLGLSPPCLTNGPRQSYDSQRSARSHHSGSCGSSTSFQATSHSRPQDDNATLKALRRAEYSRLVEFYGQERAAHYLAVLDHQQHRNPSTATSPAQPSLSPVVLEPLRAPPLDGQETNRRRASGTSVSDSCWDTCSGISSLNRASLVSFCADPSISTAHTSLVEEETTRDGIRKLVAEMRSTYLDALEAHPLPPTKAKPRKKKRRSKQTSTPDIPRDSSPSKSTPPSTSGLGRSTWLEDNNSSGAPMRRRIYSECTGPVGGLSPIQASPPRGEDDNIGIKRADSTTLGGLMAELTRSMIQSREDSRTISPSPESRIRQPIPKTINDNTEPPHPVTPKGQSQSNRLSWLNTESDSAEEALVDSPQEDPKTQYQPRIVPSGTPNISRFPSVTSQVPDKFESLYQDLFGKDVDDLWSTSSAVSSKDLAPSVRPTYSGDNGSSFTHRSSHPRDPSHITSIAEVPENVATHTRTHTAAQTTAKLSSVVKPPGNFF